MNKLFRLYQNILHSRLLVPILIAIALGVRIFSYWIEPGISRDGVLYVQSAELWFQCNDFEEVDRYWSKALDSTSGFWVPPLYPFLLLLTLHCAIPAEIGGIILNLLFGTATCYLFYRIALTICKQKEIAVIVLSIAALHPQLIELSVAIQRDALYLLLAGCSVWLLLLDWEQYKPRHWVMQGCIISLGCLCRFEMLEFFAFFAIYFGCKLLFYKMRFWLCCQGVCILLATFSISMIILSWTITGNINGIWHHYNSIKNKLEITTEKVIEKPEENEFDVMGSQNV